MKKKIFLIEIGTEELPAKLLRYLIDSFYNHFANELKNNRISYEKINFFATPRRLALQVINIENKKQKKEIIKKGPSIKNAFDSFGKPTKIAYCWAKKYNLNINDANKLKTKNGEWLIYYKKEKIEKIELILPKIIESSLKKININHFMRWNNINEIKFCRPIRNIVMLLNKSVIISKIFNITSTNILYNHVAFKEKKIYLQDAKEYPDVLFKKNKIIANYDMRKEKINIEIEKKAQTIQGFIKKNFNLIEEVNSLVESPNVCLGRFNKKYIDYIPSEILAYTIEKQQKCFPIYDSKKNILPYFIFVSNIHPKNTTNIINGNEKVINSRLSDTMFFFKKDKKIKLENYLVSLKKTLFYKELGTLYQKTIRLKKLTEYISFCMNENIQYLSRAVLLSKCDLMTNLVCEFPELQGIIGMHYALKDQEKKEVCTAIKEQYLPAFSKDKLPSTLIGCVLSIADKIDTISGMFLVNKNPSSEKDPFGLRRATLGVIRIIITKKISLNLQNLIIKSLNLYKRINNKDNHLKIFNQIKKFFIARLLFFYEKKKYHSSIIQSVLSLNSLDILEVNQKIQAISEFKEKYNYKSIVLTIKRITNILKNYDKKYQNNLIDTNLIQEKEEKDLLYAIKDFQNQTKELFNKKKYIKILFKIKDLENPINHFFNNVKINHINPEIRKNRLTLLMKLKENLFKIIDFSFLY